MRPNPLFASDDPDLVRQLIRENPWATLVSHNDGEVVASHYPVLIDEEAPGLAIVTHLGRPDEEVHGLTEGELLVIVQGRHTSRSKRSTSRGRTARFSGSTPSRGRRSPSARSGFDCRSPASSASAS